MRLSSVRVRTATPDAAPFFVDEVHRFNKSQQDAFLPHIEDGTIFFIGATTENPSFELNSALLSRARVYLLKSLTTEDIEKVLTQAMDDKSRGYGGQDIVLPDETRRAIAELVNGDARRALNTLEMMADMAEVDDAGKRVLKPELLTEIAGERSARFDNKGDRFTISFRPCISPCAAARRMRRCTGMRVLLLRVAIRYTSRAAVWRLRQKMSAMPTRVPCRSRCRPGTVSPGLDPQKVSAPLRRRLFIWPVRRKAMPSIPRLRPRCLTHANARTTMYRFICVMRRPN